jgi:signal peptidase I
MTNTQKKKSTFREYAEAIVIAVLIALFIRTFIVQAFKIPSGSMIPTLLVGDHLFVNKFIYGVRVPFRGNLLIPVKEPERFDVIVFRYPGDRSIDYIKRVVGLPGDSVEMKNRQLLINGAAVDDEHAYYGTGLGSLDQDSFGPRKVPEGKYFVMGDNRHNSSDSRVWGFVDQSDILGKAMIIYWSWNSQYDLLSWQRFSSIRWQRLGDIID